MKVTENIHNFPNRACMLTLFTIWKGKKSLLAGKPFSKQHRRKSQHKAIRQGKLVIWRTPPSSSQLFSVENSITSQQMHIAATLMLSRWKILIKNKILVYQPVLYFCWEDTLHIQTEASPLLLDIKEIWWGKKKSIKGEVIEMLKWTWKR